MGNNLLKTFLLKKTPNLIINKGKGIYLFSNTGKKYTDLTGGYTGHAILGWSDKNVWYRYTRIHVDVSSCFANPATVPGSRSINTVIE